MKAIGFKNFRKYKEFPMMELSSTTILVGANNSGKSTIVKAMLLIDEIIRNTQHAFLQNRRGGGYKYEIDLNAIKNMPLGSFERNLHNGASKDDGIELSWIGESGTKYTVTIVSGAGVTSSKVIIKTFEIFSEEHRVKILFDIAGGQVEVQCYPGCLLTFERILSLEFIWNKTKSLIRNAFVHGVQSGNNRSVETKVEIPLILRMKLEIERDDDREVCCLKDLISIKTCLKGINVEGALPDNWARIDDAKEYEIAEPFASIKEVLAKDFSFQNRIEYITSYGLYPKSIFLISDSNDLYSQTITRYCSVSSNKSRHQIKKWLEYFGIGEDIKVENITGDAYVVKIKDDNGWCNLCDKGLGAIRMVTYLMKIFDIITSTMEQEEIENEDGEEGRPKTYCPVTIIFEEPEQNLHPSSQSKLADLFYGISSKYNIKFVVETHSEYLVRRTQVIELQNYLVKNKFDKVVKPIDNLSFFTYYVPACGVPYLMRCQTNGKFNRNFGHGFFDVADNSAIELYELLKSKLL